MDNRNPKRLKNLFSFFKSNSPTNIGDNAIPDNEHDENADESEVETENDQHERVDTEEELEIEDDQDIDITSLERDPGKRRHIGCSFRGHDESVDSPNGGNFDAVLGSFKRMNNEVNKVVDNAPGNAKYTSPKIQKQIANILGNKVRAIIRSEIEDSKFFILVDEALDVSNKEQMAIILRFVDREGLIRERFFKVISVGDTCSQTLKEEICKVLAHYDLQVENIRGQGYNGANNMRGQFKGLQALFLRECPYAYYVHCFAHRLQLCLNAAAKGEHDVRQFFSTLTLIVNFVDSFAKRHSMLKIFREEEISDLIAVGTLETGKGKNQVCTLKRAGATRWGSHFRSISSLIKLFGATRATIDDLYINGVDKVQGEAKAVGKALKKFDFVFCLHMMHDIMRITDFLCQALQKKDLDILNALHFLSITKEKLQSMRENGWDDLILKVGAFCCENDISMPDMSAPYKKGLRNCEKNITNAHYYRVNIFYSVIDFQLTELDSRFTESSLEILVLSASLDPRYGFRAFKREDVCKLALKYYPLDFSSYDRLALDLECEFFVADIDKDPRFTKITSISDLCCQMVDFGKTSFYPMIYRLVCLILTLSVSTARTERAFSSMNIIKNKLRNKMNDEFLDDLMVLYIERIYADNIKNQDVIAEFELGGPRRVKFS
ncbi:hypothetical protein RND81_12G099300 [Saponaria officinalis]|uniref:Uncharacterized protein n=1 Tax=Saponaria officinalis TaxID=3572 RepID=A0AAW1H8P3_SAPOF